MPVAIGEAVAAVEVAAAEVAAVAVMEAVVIQERPQKFVPNTVLQKARRDVVEVVHRIMGGV
jgi:hypothetical protein